VKPGKSKGKKEQDQEMRMPAKEFDRIMGRVMGAPETPRKPEALEDKPKDQEGQKK
jgi:hypothetical protein